MADHFQDSINPYSPPKSALEPNYEEPLDNNAYVKNNILITKESFKPPLICAKSGTPLDIKNLRPLKVTLIWKPIFSPPFYRLVVLITIVSYIACIFYSVLTSKSDLLTYIFPSGAALILVYKLLLNRPVKISFYFSETYRKNRKMNILIYSIASGIVAFSIAYIVISGYEPIVFALIILLCIILVCFKMTITPFKAFNPNNDDFYHLFGVHKNVLNKLPTFPEN